MAIVQQYVALRCVPRDLCNSDILFATLRHSIRFVPTEISKLWRCHSQAKGSQACGQSRIVAHQHKTLQAGQLKIVVESTYSKCSRLGHVVVQAHPRGCVEKRLWLTVGHVGNIRDDLDMVGHIRNTCQSICKLMSVTCGNC